MSEISGSVFLKPDVKMELLAGGWFAWSHLVSPPQHAMNIAFRHLPLMRSFVANPEEHIAAASDPTLFGGPFVDLLEESVPEISRLIDETEDQCRELIQFAHDFKRFDQQVQLGARGAALYDFYNQMPSSLAGATEVAYDLNNHASLRLIEEITYKYRLDNRRTQRVRLSHQTDARRKFFMSTPRMAGNGDFLIQASFGDRRLDTLSSSRINEIPFERISGLFDVDDSALENFATFFTREPPRRQTPNYNGDEVRVRYFGHACVLVQTNRHAILIDPMVTWDADDRDGRFTFCDLPDRIDYVILSHCHQDHLCPEVLVQLRHRVKTLVVPRSRGGSMADPSMKLILNRLGYSDIKVMDAFDVLTFSEGEIVSLPFSGEHADIEIHSKHTILLRIKGRSFFFLVDSDAIDPALYHLVAQFAGPLDASFVGMECYGAPLTWLYGPLLTRQIRRRDDESRRLSASNCERAWRLMRDLDCSTVFIYAMGQEPWLRYLMGLEYQPGSIQLQQARNFVERCREAGIKIEQLRISREILF